MTGARAAAVATALERALLRLYPANFRHDVGNQIVYDVRERARRLAAAGSGGVTIWLVRLAASLVANAFAEWAERLWSFSRLDLKLGLRMLRKQWALTLFGGVAMALAITGGAAVFELQHVFVGTSVPLEEGDRIVVIQPFDREAQEGQSSSVEDFQRWNRELSSVQDVGAFRATRRDLITVNGPAAPVSVAEMSASGFELARVAPLLGRFLLAEDETTDAPPVVVLGHNAWRVTFAADPDVVGQTVQLDDVFHTVVGVMPEGFAFPVNHQYWTRLGTNPLARVTVFGRVAAGAALQNAQAEVETMGLLEVNPVESAGRPLQPRVVAYVTGITGDPGFGILALLPLVLPLLLIPPCGNLAILVYARTMARQGEFAARTALGASRARIVGQIFAEILVLSAAAAALALVLTPRLVDFLRYNLIPGGFPFWMDFGLSYATIGYAIGLAVVAALIAGAIPALGATGRWSLLGLHALGARSVPKLGKVWTGLVMLQAGLSVAILPTGAELAWALSGVSINGTRFTAENYLTARLSVDPRVVPDPFRFATIRGELVRQLKAEPGVTDVTFAEALPSQETYVQVQVEAPDSIERTAFNRVDLEFFDTFSTRILAGRRFDASDLEPGRNTILVNRSFARRILAEGNPLGRRLRTVAQAGGTGPWLEVVGVVDDFSDKGGHRTFYQPLPAETGPLRLAIHAVPQVLPDLPGRLREIAASLDRSLRIDPVRTMDGVYESFWLQDLTLASGLAGLMLGLVLFSVAGIYTLMAFTVVQRRREIGIRSALGASPSRLIAGIFRSVLVPVSVGVALGGVAAVLMDYYWSPILFDFREGGRPFPWILPAAEALLILTGLLVAASPARQALRLDNTSIFS